jgi:hypothetical protein
VAKHADLVVHHGGGRARRRAGLTLGPRTASSRAGAKHGLTGGRHASTIAPAAAQPHRRAARRSSGLHFLDAPVSGGEVGAINAALSIMVGGEAAAFEQARPQSTN